jgi:glyoxylase-like metal-dependent hydrolase (beta-lactamase superfamily II)
MSEATQRWQVGDTRITSVVEAQTDGIPPGFLFPGADDELIARHAWLAPHYAGEGDTIGMRVQAFVVEAGGHTVVVDPCLGNGRVRAAPWFNDQHWPFMDRFRAAGFDPAAVDLVVHTHLHVDHVGWDTHRQGDRWVPTFPHARHLYVGAEIDSLRADTGAEAVQIRADAVEPIFAAGLADVVEPDAELGAGLRLAPTPGHTPGHACLWVEDGGRLAVVTGDVVHHPVQCAEPDLGFTIDADAAAARATRRTLLTDACDAQALVLGTHFPTRPGGRLAPDGDAWRFTPLAAEA